MEKERIRILLVEDELLIAENISGILKKEGFSDIRIVKSTEEALKQIESKKPDLVFTDIALGKGMTGIDLGHILKKQYNIPFIYITSHFSSKIVREAKETFPAAYLTKPFKKEDLIIALELCLHEKNGNDTLIVKDGHDTIRIPYSRIVWIKAEKNYSLINILNEKPRLIREVIADLIGRLPDDNFIRVHKSYAVNFSYVKEIKSSFLVLEGDEVPIGRVYKKAIQKYRSPG